MKEYANITLALALLSAGNVQAADLAGQIDQFFRNQFPAETRQVQVKIKTPQNQWPECENPELRLPANARPWGNVSLSVRCGQQRRFLQTQVQVSGKYLVATRQLAAGEKLTEKEMTYKEGRLDTLPPGALLDARFAKGTLALRHINAGQPLTRTMLRRSWVVKAGQAVQVVAEGEGFNVNSEGKAMNNAALQDNVRVRMVSGQIVSGTVGDDGVIRIML
ncbi:flagellar basal body P-ring formation chaperone FlgA [Yersinia ruckeri]|uniref:Flagella basal body P-ring formation protein FlgA n=1 Tax=Yersinia ruckeri TaxID=29486 RepID=C8BKB6_YERRU|nr:flagellar basal body P-ring formation chaperone FlgA [Yersinia ruckeri]ACT22780.1 flagellar basal body P-ring biosynthesis protein FlgA [Yersinia ruckeri]AKA37593.1 flagellar basal body P-ring biosynthesis protein FlgA [Yersinia ruckeri]ARZ00605.1 flagellar basal body P-ring biosynthesis protein FlgA [Yersinia ruckeri]AUQ42730.1 flagellar basal body P-ring formation protein FlgA [Yersinia ruckeri]EEP98838.1 Flagella basal body P-ring formation protein flgA [Yersinia ruckeri ATCC 29473]